MQMGLVVRRWKNWEWSRKCSRREWSTCIEQVASMTSGYTSSRMDMGLCWRRRRWWIVWGSPTPFCTPSYPSPICRWATPFPTYLWSRLPSSSTTSLSSLLLISITIFSASNSKLLSRINISFSIIMNRLKLFHLNTFRSRLIPFLICTVNIKPEPFLGQVALRM